MGIFSRSKKKKQRSATAVVDPLPKISRAGQHGVGGGAWDQLAAPRMPLLTLAARDLTG